MKYDEHVMFRPRQIEIEIQNSRQIWKPSSIFQFRECLSNEIFLAGKNCNMRLEEGKQMAFRVTFLSLLGVRDGDYYAGRTPSRLSASNQAGSHRIRFQ